MGGGLQEAEFNRVNDVQNLYYGNSTRQMFLVLRVVGDEKILGGVNGGTSTSSTLVFWTSPIKEEYSKLLGDYYKGSR